MSKTERLQKRAASLARGQIYDPVLRKFVKTNLVNAVAAKKRLNLEEAIIRGREEPAEKYR